MSGVSESTDGGVVLSLFLMVGAITYALYTFISVYVSNSNKIMDSNETTTQALVRLFSAGANIGNSIIHILLVVYIKANEGSDGAFWAKERELEADGIGGPLGLAIMNFAAGMCSIHNKQMIFPLVWNSFVVVAGTLIPLVWLRFIEEGLATWPYVIIFIWFVIFAMELSAFSAIWTYKLIKTDDATANKSD
mmetsp:Transcript_1458/g.3286  ORF Transcript_1458/g.3286 Transcript_1458/m.3286 type:complete len:192 (+) Transcript_1458:160-735(+)|eukprot:CAMPEP_0201124642 /NCGR_PEP_ID=MMETSP0850-20130426/16097_1 /ASSEMBLY_ACC=CAM_ASM_000622 /TAXON_ID=183588 /ORGANISM="Pseudo-nitzschia fraudulenta, Strain WWA7" /LENGTH=191 /DNA_ID=CAMNT_0047392181 /DNA_START=94 /DNA_END=669 /DNA_ORIENTATION=+